MGSGKIALALAIAAHAAAGHAAPAYRLAQTVALGGPDRWDYAVIDAGRLYVAHGDRVEVLDTRSGAIVGKVEGIAGGTHGTAISRATGQGITTDGRNGQAIVFDLKSLKVTRRIPAKEDADAAVLDRATGDVFIIEGDPATISVVDPRKEAVVATIPGGEKMEYAAADDAGTVYVAGEEKGDLLRIDARAAKVVARWPVPDCASPHGLALDRADRRLFMGCVNGVMAVLDAGDGHVVARLPIGRGSDAVAYDARRRRVFSSNGADGTVSIYRQTGPDAYSPLDTVATAVSGRTMAVDPASGRFFVVAADTDPPAAPGGRPRPRPGTLKVLIFDSVG